MCWFAHTGWPVSSRGLLLSLPPYAEDRNTPSHSSGYGVLGSWFLSLMFMHQTGKSISPAQITSIFSVHGFSCWVTVLRKQCDLDCDLDRHWRCGKLTRKDLSDQFTANIFIPAIWEYSVAGPKCSPEYQSTWFWRQKLSPGIWVYDCRGPPQKQAVWENLR